MEFRHLHPWHVSYQKALEIQESLRTNLACTKLTEAIRYVAGADVASSKRIRKVWAGVVVMTYPDLEPVDRAWVAGTPRFPYIPGLLSFRELPFVLRALKKIRTVPHVILCDGQGIAHPRRMGLASHLGLLTGVPTIGCAKTRLIGEFREIGPHRGEYSLLYDQGDVVGAVLRTRGGVRPMFISPGHAVTLEDSLGIVLNCTPRYRLAEPVRQVHFLVTRRRRLEENG